MCVAQAIVYAIWGERNNRFFGQESTSVDVLFSYWPSGLSKSKALEIFCFFCTSVFNVFARETLLF